MKFFSYLGFFNDKSVVRTRSVSQWPRDDEVQRPSLSCIHSIKYEFDLSNDVHEKLIIQLMKFKHTKFKNWSCLKVESNLSEPYADRKQKIKWHASFFTSLDYLFIIIHYIKNWGMLKRQLAKIFYWCNVLHTSNSNVAANHIILKQKNDAS